MQIAIVQIGNNKAISDYAKAFSQAILTAGNSVTIINGILERKHLGFFHYFIFIVESPAIFGKNYLNDLSLFFKESGKINAHFASIYVNKTSKSAKFLLKYMVRIESEGFILHETAVINGQDHAILLSKSLQPIHNRE